MKVLIEIDLDRARIDTWMQVDRIVRDEFSTIFLGNKVDPSTDWDITDMLGKKFGSIKVLA